MDLVRVINGTIVDPKEGIVRNADLLIRNGIIDRIAKPGQLEEGGITVDAKDCLVLPGLVDVHVHFRDPGQTHKEDINTGAMAAAAGGFTTCVMMANTSPTVDNVETLRHVKEKAAMTPIHLYPAATVTKGMKGKELTDFNLLLKEGATGFTDDGVPILDEALLSEALNELACLGVPVSLHEEDPKYIGKPGVNDGEVSRQILAEGVGASEKAEYTMVERDIRIASETGAVLNIQHISSAKTVNLLRQARKENKNIHGEATPHHIRLTQEAVLSKGTLAKMNPPLRTQEDRKAIIEGLMDGSLDIIATDHAPHAKEEKERPFTEAPSGIVGLETSLSICYDELVLKNDMPVTKLMELMSYNPAKMYGLNAGYIAEGGPGDLCIFNPKMDYKVDKLHSKSSNSPFLGEVLTGKVIYTICNGKIVYSMEK